MLLINNAALYKQILVNQKQLVKGQFIEDPIDSPKDKFLEDLINQISECYDIHKDKIYYSSGTNLDTGYYYVGF